MLREKYLRYDRVNDKMAGTDSDNKRERHENRTVTYSSCFVLSISVI